MFTRSRVAVQPALVGLAVLLPWPTLHGQEINGQGGEEIRLLQEVSAREASGDYGGAEQILESILAERPTSVAALFAAERIYRVQGRPADILGPLDRFLEADPHSAIAHRMRIQTLSELDRREELGAAVEAWIAATPKLETPYREIARILMARGDHAWAARILERGRSQVGRPDALALELGEVYAVLGDMEGAVREWDRAIGPEARGFSLVRRRLNSLQDGGARVLPGLIAALTKDPTTPARRRAATELAIAAGLAGPAERIARGVAKDLAPADREAFLIDVARRADGARLPTLAYWAYGELLSTRADTALLALRMRLAELALVVGDTAAARENFAIVEQAFAEGSPERRQAIAMRIELTANEGEVENAMRELEAFRAEYGDVPELDRLVAAVGDALLRRGQMDRAASLLGSTRGPRSGLIRGRLALHRGDLAEARRAFLAAASGLEGTEATEVLTLVTLLGRLSAEGGELLAQAMARAMQERVPEALTILVQESVGLDRGERAALLDFAAGLADRADLPAEAERIRRVIVADHPDAPEAPAALLSLGRALAVQQGGAEEARAFLERLIVEYPRSALVPQARRELDRLHGRVPQP